MATYTGIKGFKVQSLASDPTTDIEGQIWYNTTSSALKYTGPGTGAWTTGGNMATNRTRTAAGGTQSASFAGGGGTHAGGTATEEYDGSTWGSGGAMPTALFAGGGAGTVAAGLSFGGYAPTPVPSPNTNLCFEYDGSTWTAGGSLNTERAAGAGFGTQTAAMYSGGQGDAVPTPAPTSNEEYNGVGWTITGIMNQAAQIGAACGTTTAGLYAGYSPATPTQTCTWNGTSWTQVSPGAFSVDMYNVNMFGTTSSALRCSGLPPTTDTTPNLKSVDEWDGSTWTATTSKTYGGAAGNGTGTTTLGLSFGGYNPLNNPPSYYTDANKTEEWAKPVFATKTVTVS
jgi:hypothetical protein